MSELRELEPRDVFTYFDEICAIPHGSKNLAAISDYCVRFAEEHGLRYRQEPCGNVIIWKDASLGYEDAPTVMLQGHLDMVAVKEEGCDIDLASEGLRVAVTDDGEWVYAEGTTLGGDDGIAVAFELAILADDSLPHPALEAVFTVNEEIGLVGATDIDASDLKSSILLNIDSEEEGQILTSCAGGATFRCILPAERKKMYGAVYEWKAEGLLGGHSGCEIDLGRANANDLFGRFLTETAKKAPYRIGEFSGGEKDNAIPNHFRAILVTDEENAERLERAAAKFSAAIEREYAAIEPNLKITLTRTDRNEADVLKRKGDRALRIVLEMMPAGIQRMDPEIPGLVQTSLNLGVVRTGVKEMRKGSAGDFDECTVLTYAVRSSSKSQKKWILRKMKNVTAIAGGRSEVEGEYPAWEYLPDSRIRDIMSDTYEELCGTRPELIGIHGGVECGIFAEKLPGIDAVSYGPTMKDIHTVGEMMNVASVGRTYELTKRVLEKLK